jgi:DNA-binding CsgD family transcriptional regulator
MLLRFSASKNVESVMNKINRHPVLLHASDIRDICEPLRNLNISYFAHVNIDRDGQFSAISNNPGFHKHYLEKEYYHADIHLSSLSAPSRFVLWSGLECGGSSAQMQRDANEFNLYHTFTIINQDVTGKNFYHFSTHIKDLSFNQTYLSNLDLLQMFIQHFCNNIRESQHLSASYKIKFMIVDNQAEYTVNSSGSLYEQRLAFLNEMSEKELITGTTINCRPKKSRIILIHNESKRPVPIPKQQMKCLDLLMEGYTGKEVARKLGLSLRTVNHYLEALRDKLGCKTSKELIALYYGQVIQQRNLIS